MYNFEECIFILAYVQHQRWRDGKWHIKPIVNLAFARYTDDYCMDAWIENEVGKK
jgi:hypothetical protein